MPGYGDPPSVTISHSSTPYDHLGEGEAVVCGFRAVFVSTLDVSRSSRNVAGMHGNNHLYTYTSDFDVNLRSNSASGLIHLKGTRPLGFIIYCPSRYMSRARPKSDTLTVMSSPTRIFLAARSRWMMFLKERYC